MIRLQRYLLGELLAAFLLVCLIVTGIFLAGSLLQFLHRYSELGVGSLLAAAPLIVPIALPITVPLSYLVACLLTYGRFSDDNEFLAMQMGGIHPWNAVAPAILAASVLSVGTLWLNADVNPRMTLLKKSVARREVEQLLRAIQEPSVTRLQLGELEMSWAGREAAPHKVVLKSLKVGEEPEGGGERVIRAYQLQARRARLSLHDEPRMQLVVDVEDARMPVEDATGRTVMTVRSAPIGIDLDRLVGVSPLLSSKGADEMRAEELYYRMHRLSAAAERNRTSSEMKQYRRFAAEYWRRIALGLSPLAFTLIGVPLGLLSARGSRWTAVVIALGIALPVYYPLFLLGENLAKSGTLPIALALNLPNVALGATGLVLLRRVVRA